MLLLAFFFFSLELYFGFCSMKELGDFEILECTVDGGRNGRTSFHGEREMMAEII